MSKTAPKKNSKKETVKKARKKKETPLEEYCEMFLARVQRGFDLAPSEVVLREYQGLRAINVEIGKVEASQILLAMKYYNPIRETDPMLHDLTQTIFTAFGVRVRKAFITEVWETFGKGAIEVVQGESSQMFETRAADAVVYAVLYGLSIRVAPEILEARSFELDLSEEAGDEYEYCRLPPATEPLPSLLHPVKAPEKGFIGDPGYNPRETENQVPEAIPHEETITVEDEQWADLLEEMDPDDFKYKM